MAKDTIEIDINVDDNGTTQKATLNSKKAGQEFDKTTQKADKYSKGQKGVAQATANSTKAFSKMQGGMTGMVGIYAEVASRVFALSAAFQFLKNASDVTNLIAGQEAMGAATGVAYKTLTEDLKAATDGQLAYADAARAAAIGTAAGLSASQLEEIGTAAKNVSNALGRDLRDSFERLTRGITKAEPELLDELGIILRLETAKKNYAAQIGKTANTLTQFEQSQAIANEVLTQAEEKFGKIEELMDPSAASLNKFLTSFDDLMNSLKTGSMTVLRPVFDFLSQNTMALVSTLGFIGVTVLKAILPNMTEWRNSSKLASESAAKDMMNYRAQVTASKVALQDFMKTQDASKAKAVGLSQGVMGDFGTVTKGGGAAKDFFSGASDSGRARSNAARVLVRAEREMDQHGQVITGMLKGYNAQQLADMRASYNMRAQVLDNIKQKHKFTLESMKMHWNVWFANAKAKLAGLKAAMSAFGAWAAKWGGRLMAAFGWIGLLSMAVTYVKGFIEGRLPQHLQELNKQSKEFTSSLETLNDELEKMDQVQASGMLSAMELASQIGKASASVDLYAKVVEYQALKQKGSSNELTKAREKLEETAQALADLDPRYQKYADTLERNGELKKEELIDLKNTTNAMIEQGNAIDNLGKAQQSFNQSFAKANSGIKPLNILQDQLNVATTLRDTLSKAAEGGQAAIDNALPKEFVQNRKRIEAMQDAHIHKGSKTYGEAIEAGIFGGFAAALGVSSRARTNFLEDFKTAEKKFTTDDMVFSNEEQRQEAIANANREMEKLKENLTDGQKALLKLSERYEDISGLVEIINQKSTTSINIAQAQLQIGKANKELMNRGVTVQERITNLQIEANKDKIKEGDLTRSLLTAELKLEAAKRDKSENAAELVKTAQYELDVIKLSVDVEKRRAELAREIRQEKEIQLQLERQLNPLIAARNANEIKLMQQQRSKKGVDSGATSFGFGQAAASRVQQTALLQVKINIAQGKYNEALKTENTLKSGGKKMSVKELAALTQKTKLAKESLKNARQELAIHQARFQIMFNQMQAQTQTLQFNTQNAGMNSLQASYNAEVLKYLNAGITPSQKQLDLIKQQVQYQGQMTAQLQDQEAIRQGITSSLASTIADLIKGNISSFEDAIKQLAEGILNSIADVLANRIANMIVNKIFPIKHPVLIAHQQAMPGIQSAMQTGAQQGITTAGNTLNTNLQTTFTDAADKMKKAIEEACKACICKEGGAGSSTLPDSIPTKAELEGRLKSKLKGELDSDVKDMVKENLIGDMGAGDLKKDLANDVKDSLKDSMGDIGKDLGKDLTSSISTSMGQMMSSIGSTMMSMMTGLMSMITGMMSSIMSLMSTMGGGILSIFGFNNGGISHRGRPMQYATGGIARGSERGYPAVLHGTEAVVPLPNGKSIPVEMTTSNSNSQQTNHVTVNISSEGQTSTEGSPGVDQERLGKAVATAVQKELQNQKRSGGILSPYGVA